MIIFAAGNKFKLFYQNKAPNLVHGYYYVYAYKWIKSRKTWTNNPSTYNIGPHYEVVGE